MNRSDPGLPLSKASPASLMPYYDSTAIYVYVFRVRAIGPVGEGPWSDEGVKLAA